MVIPDWAIEGAKYIGSMAVGAIGTKWSSRGTRQRMRRHLYKETANNYGQIAAGLVNAQAGVNAILAGSLPGRLHKESHDDALKHVDIYHELSDSYALDTVYIRLDDVATAADSASVVSLAIRLVVGIEDMLLSGELNMKLFKRMAQPWVRNVLERRLAERRQASSPSE